jgi:hypothetical protein
MNNDNTAFLRNLAELTEETYARLHVDHYGHAPRLKELLDETIDMLAKSITIGQEQSRRTSELSNELLALQQEAELARAALAERDETIANLRLQIETSNVIRIQHQAPNAQLARAKTLVVRDMLQRREDAASYNRYTGATINWADADYDEEAMYERMVKLVVDDDKADDVWSLTRTYEADVVLTVKVRMSVTAKSAKEAEEHLSDTLYQINLRTPYAGSELDMHSEVQDIDVDSVEIDER